jgi:hypothetical protein
LQRVEHFLVAANVALNCMDYRQIYDFHQAWCHESDCLQPTTVSLLQQPQQPSGPAQVLLHREIRGFPAMASYSAASALTIPDGAFTLMNPDVRLFTAGNSPFSSSNNSNAADSNVTNSSDNDKKTSFLPLLLPSINALGVDETNYGYVVTADFYNEGTKMYEIEVVDDERLLKSQNALEDAVESLQSLSSPVPKPACDPNNPAVLLPMPSPTPSLSSATSSSATSLTAAAIPYSNVSSTANPVEILSDKFSSDQPEVLNALPTSLLDEHSAEYQARVWATTATSTSTAGVDNGGCCDSLRDAFDVDDDRKFLAKSIEGMPVFISTTSARFRRGPKLQTPFKITLKGVAELLFDHNNKIVKWRYKFTH